MMIDRSRLIAVALFLIIPFTAHSQSTTSSPYSMFGIGEIRTGDHGENAGMANLGIGFRQYNQLNNANPAALTAIERQTMVLYGGVWGKSSWYSQGSLRDNAFSGNISKIAMGFRLSKRFAYSAGISPLTNVGYVIRKDAPVEGSTEEFTTIFEGSGGLSKFFMSLAWQISPKWSLGVNGVYVMGALTQTESQPAWTIDRTEKTNRVYADFGVQYSGRFSNQTDFTVGATGGYKTRLAMRGKLLITDSNGETVQDKGYKAADQYIPENYGIGFTVNHKGKMTVGADYTYQKWSRLTSQSASVLFKDEHKVVAGISFIPNPLSIKFLEHAKYQLGIKLGNSYLQLHEKTPVNYAVTAGVVFPLKSRSTFNVALEYGNRGSMERGIILERYVKVTLGFSFKESWFVRFKYD